MIRRSIPLVCAAALLLGACGSDSNLPEATGKASIRAINAIPMSSEINFLIEERPIGPSAYQNATAIAQYDDLNYTFNFEVFFAGESSVRRFANQNIDIEANKIYDFLVSGSLQSPSVTIWQSDLRTFDEADTVFATKFAHASASLGELDYYFADAATAPALGNQIATLSFGEISESTDFPEGDFVLTIATAGDPSDVVYTSDAVTYTARDVYRLTAFDGDESDTAPHFVRAFSDLGNAVGLPDVNFPPTMQFVNASMDLGATDIYDDELLTSLRVANHDYLDVSAELEIAADAVGFFYTPAGDPSAVLLETALEAVGGIRYRIVSLGAADSLGAVASIPNLRPVDTHAKFLPFHTSNNFEFLDLYLVESDVGIEDRLPVRRGLARGEVTQSLALAADAYDFYVTELDQKVPLAGPYRVTISVGDIVDLLIVDTVDPAVLDVLFLSGGPTP
jgi:hypothetical protein